MSLKVSIFTWGSCRYGYADVLYPNYVRLTLLTSRPGEHTVDTEHFVLRYNNRDSRKNMHRCVEIVPKSRIVVRYYGAQSCNPKSRFDEVYLLEPGKEPALLDVKSEVVTVESGNYIVEKCADYVVVDGKKLVVKEVEVSRRRTKLVLYVKRVNGFIEVSGDTYNVKDILKQHGFRWDAGRKVWIGKELPSFSAIKTPVEVVEQ